jgi:RNA-directed DNA polymerase
LILEPPDRVQKLQAALQAKAKGSPGYRFYLLYDKVYRKDVLEYAYRCCKANRGAPGVDSQDFADIEKYGEERWLGELADTLHRKTYRAEAVRRVWIPKSDGRKRPLRIPCIADRTVMTAAVVALTPIFGAPGEAWRFQRVRIPHRQGEEPPHRESSLGLMEVTT